MTVYCYIDRRVAFEGTRKECRDFVMNQAFTMEDGRRIYRYFEDEDGMHVYDVGALYCTYEDILAA